MGRVEKIVALMLAIVPVLSAALAVAGAQTISSYIRGAARFPLDIRRRVLDHAFQTSDLL